VAPGPRQARDEAAADRVVRCREYDWNDRCRLLGCEHRGSRRDDDINLAPDELGRDLGVALAASFRPANLDRNGAVLDPAEFAQTLYEPSEPLALDRRRSRAQDADGRQLACLLPARAEWPRYGAAKCDDELAPSHELPSDEAHNLAHNWAMKALCIAAKS